ncbi:LacI family DNA-binding transcriptional regulator [Streptomyces sp. VRA16 Mangrove soil]|uniref:LacI family DNA-binding transcriptional regulator n=1 Tax=Streptomyces sp. VRA16 Mangrove soil TaxID=2817434 RepID=UPI001A9E9AF4|nr:LacI family DNA-binding transcriptional regulator [Streptomyces sp. VRA16 Mangrove soil]MBO1334218.1 LacI family DNA-binding transcriptional regulator [Streptomyces sp. VRA16 Mangrove soil]
MAHHGMHGRRPTLEEVAARAGVGRGTVSRVINGSPRVSDRTRAAVEEAVAALGYVPNTAARALAANRTDSIAVVVPEAESRFFSEPYFSGIVGGVGIALAETNLQLLLTFAGGEREQDKLASYLAAHRVDGVLLVSVHSDDPLADRLHQMDLPTVISGPRSADEPLPSVDSDNLSGARAAVEHLVSRGRRSVAIITGPLDVYGAERRLAGYQDQLIAEGLPYDEELIAYGDFTEEGGRRCMAELLERRPGLDAVFACSDLMASGARQVLREAGRRIPDDVALVGFDDSVIAQHMEPSLTSVRQPTRDMGRAMTGLLLDEIALAAEGKRSSARRGAERHLVLPTELVIRASS